MNAESLENHVRTRSTSGYHHARFETRRRFLRSLIKYLGVPLLAKIDRVEGLSHIPQEGAGILMINHISFVDSLLTLHFIPNRNLVPLAKAGVLEYPVINIFPKMWGVITVQRDAFDRQAVKQALAVLKAGEMVLVAPEGTRGAALRQGKEGVAYLASRSGAPVIPVAIQGTVGFPSLRYTTPAWRGPGAYLQFGKPFRYKAEFQRAGREDLRRMTDEAMFVLSSMLPIEQRGVYADLAQATQDTFDWL